MAIKHLIFLLSILIYQILCKDFTEKLRWTFELINHGARSPHKGLDKDFKDFSNHTWIGENELTGVGLRQSFLIGYRDRLRYLEEKELISKEYDPREMLVYASENNRTLMSANALLHGLYPPGTGPTIDPSLVDRAVPPVDSSLYIEEKERLDQCNYTALPDRMNLIPVHINFAHEYFTQYETSKKCGGLKTYEENNKKRDEVVDFLNEMNNKYKNLNKIFPKDKASLKDYESAYTFFDTLYCLYYDAAEEFDKILKIVEMEGKEKEVIDDCQTFLKLNTVGSAINDTEFIDYLVFPLFNKILSFMELVIEKDSNGEEDYRGYDLPKYYIISAVANTCGSFMAFMNKIFNTPINFIDFATNIHLELYLEEKENGTISEGDYRIDYFFNDDYLKSIRFIDFKEAVKNISCNESLIKEFCAIKEEEKKDDYNWYVIGTFIGLGIIIVLLIIIVIVVKKKRNNDRDSEFENENTPIVRETKASGE